MPDDADSKVKKLASIEPKDLYKFALDTRNLEIALFWQRCNYFLVLNTGLALGFFNLQQTKYAVLLATIGLVTSFLWVWVSLGSKFWQTRWEQRLLDFEKEHFPDLAFFAAEPSRLKTDVQNGLSFHKLGRLQETIYKLVLLKPSVSFAMILLALLFVGGWVVLIVI